MKMKHFYTIAIAFILTVWGTSCNDGLSEKKICGTWNVTNWQERASNQQQWKETPMPYGSMKLFFFEDHKVDEFHRGETLTRTYYWSYDKSQNILKYNGIPYIVEEFSGTMMVVYLAPKSNSPGRRITLQKTS